MTREKTNQQFKEELKHLLKKYKANLEITEIHTDTYHITAHLNFINEKMKWEYASIDLGKEFNFE